MNTTIQMNLKNSHAEQKKPLEKEMAIHSSILAWEIPWTEEPGALQSMGLQKSQMQLNNKFSLLSIYH